STPVVSNWKRVPACSLYGLYARSSRAGPSGVVRRIPTPGVTRITAGELGWFRCQTPPASTKAARRSRELKIGEGTRSSTLATARVNCSKEEEPKYLALSVISSEPSEPRDGSIGLLTRGSVPLAVRVASTRFCRNSATTSGVQALNEAQKLTAVASVCP